MTTDTNIQADALSLNDAMDATMRETYAKVNDAEPAANTDTEAAPETADAKSARQRDQSGRFTPAAPAAEIPPADGGDVVPPAEPAAKPAPGSWPKELRDTFGALPPTVQEFMHKREADISRTINQYSGKAKFADSVTQVLSPYEGILRADGAEPLGAINGLMKTYQVLRNAPPAEKAAAVAQMIQRFGVDLSLVGEDGTAGNSDPHVTQLYAKVNQLEQQLVQRQHADQQAEQTHVESAIAEFAQGKPHFEAVKVHMGALMQAGLAKDMADAYDQAVMAHPEIRATVLNEQESKRREEAAAKVAAAKKAGAVNITSRGVPASAKPVGSMDDTMRETYRRLNG